MKSPLTKPCCPNCLFYLEQTELRTTCYLDKPSFESMITFKTCQRYPKHTQIPQSQWCGEHKQEPTGE